MKQEERESAGKLHSSSFLSPRPPRSLIRFSSSVYTALYSTPFLSIGGSLYTKSPDVRDRCRATYMLQHSAEISYLSSGDRKIARCINKGSSLSSSFLSLPGIRTYIYIRECYVSSPRTPCAECHDERLCFMHVCRACSSNSSEPTLCVVAVNTLCDNFHSVDRRKARAYLRHEIPRASRAMNVLGRVQRTLSASCIYRSRKHTFVRVIRFVVVLWNSIPE